MDVIWKEKLPGPPGRVVNGHPESQLRGYTMLKIDTPTGGSWYTMVWCCKCCGLISAALLACVSTQDYPEATCTVQVGKISKKTQYTNVYSIQPHTNP